MSMHDVPKRVRNHLYLYRGSMVLGGLGVLGFLLSYGQVGSPAVADADLSAPFPVLAYVSIGVWVLGIALMFYSRRVLHREIEAKKAENQRVALEKMRVDDLIESLPHRESGDAGSVADQAMMDAPAGPDA